MPLLPLWVLRDFPTASFTFLYNKVTVRVNSVIVIVLKAHVTGRHLTTHSDCLKLGICVFFSGYNVRVYCRFQRFVLEVNMAELTPLQHVSSGVVLSAPNICLSCDVCTRHQLQMFRALDFSCRTAQRFQ